jgi:hypothetical protein
MDKESIVCRKRKLTIRIRSGGDEIYFFPGNK